MSITKAAERLSRDIGSADPIDRRSERLGNFDGVKGAILASLDEFERLFIVLYYAEHMTNAEIGEILEITPAEVAELHSFILRKLRNDAVTTRAA